MATTMIAPPGCFGLQMADGTKYDTDRSGRIEVADHHASAVQRSWAGHTGVVDARQPLRLGTKGTRWCLACRPSRAWQVWTIRCPRCATPTVTDPEPSPPHREEPS